ncbi:DUF3854 domain-containing protein [bacterium]|nr:DUF3854 domain-containing protein [bacterium]
MRKITEQEKLALQEDIKKSGLDLQFLEQYGIKEFTGKQENLKQKLGFASFNGHPILQTFYQILEIPYLDKQGNPLFSRFRLYPPLQGTKYLHPKGIPARPYILPLVWEVVEKPHKPLWITEGEKKALKLTKEGCLAIALSGVWNFKAGKTVMILILKSCGKNCWNSTCKVGPSF